MNRKQLLAATSVLGGFLSLAAPLQAQEIVRTAQADPAQIQTVPDAKADNDKDQATDVSALQVTGSRIKSEFNSASPIQVLTTESAAARGIADTVQFLQSSSLANGSSQNNATLSSAFVTAGGPGSATLSLRGLGATRTLVLLNGRRVGPAGTRGQVSSVDLNILPESAIERVDILKDGASSIYGSDAIAGVVNIITNQKPDGGKISAFYTSPEKPGGKQAQLSATWGKSFDKGHINVSADFYRQYQQANGQRDYTDCAEQVIFDPTTHTRADAMDPRTGKPACLGTDWGHVWVYDFNFSTRAGRFQYDYDGNLGNFIPPMPSNFNTATCAANPTTSTCDPGFPNHYFLVGYNQAARAVTNAHSPLESASSLIPDLQRATLYGEGTYKLGSGIEAYGEVLMNRRTSRQHNFRQYWTYNYTYDYDPFSVGFTGQYILSPTPITNYDTDQKVDYTRGVIGLRGDLNIKNSPWHWDVYAQYSNSAGYYNQQVILQDAIDSQSFRTGSCVGTVLPVSHRNCIDINFTDPQVLAGNLTQVQRDFLFDNDLGMTHYTQAYIEGSMSGNMFMLPAGPLASAFGFTVRRDTIKDTPGLVTQANNSWGLSSSGITQGGETTSEVFAEFNVPVLKDKFLAKAVDLQLSGRYTDVNISTSASTYKAGLNWQVTPQWKFRTTYGTSFRSPALYELYLANQTDFLSQKQVDPCIGWTNALASGSISPRLAANCANPLGPGGGVPGNHPSGGASALITTGGGLGLLKPETSGAASAGIVWTPKFADVSFALDYFHIKVKGEVTSLGSNTAFACYNSLNFPTDPVCNLFVRNPGTNRIDSITGKYINISSEVNEGFDFTTRYRRETPWGDLVSNAQFTYQLRQEQAIFAGSVSQSNGNVGYPRLVGNHTLSLAKNKWTAYWNVDYVGKQSSVAANPTGDKITIDGTVYLVKATAPQTFFHSLSLKYDFGEWTLQGGVANILDTKPPKVTTVAHGLGLYETIGNSAFSSQYTEGYYGRRYFMHVDKKFLVEPDDDTPCN